MQAYYIGCDSPPTTNNAGNRLQCTVNDGATSYIESELEEIYGIPKMDNEDFEILGTHAVLMFVIAFGVVLLRKIIGN